MKKISQEEKFKRYKSLLEKDDTAPGDLERKALFWIFAGNEDLYKKIGSLYDFDGKMINVHFDENTDFSSGSKAMVKLAFNLYNGYPADVMKTLLPLDDENYQLAMEAIAIRFGKIEDM